MMVFDLIFGFLLVFSGRNLFWLCVGIVGFLVGVQCAGLLGYTAGWMALLIALGLGCAGIVLAVVFEWFMVVFGVGFLGGGYLLMDIFSTTTGQESSSWLVFVIGGIIGTCLMVIIFDWTLILISSLLGATLIVNAFHGEEGWRGPLFIGCMVAGMVVQYLSLKDTAAVQEPSVKKA